MSNLSLPPSLQPLAEIAYNLWFSWNEEALSLFREIDAELWEQVHHNPVQLLSEMPPAEIDRLSENTLFLDKLRQVTAVWENYRAGAAWFRIAHPQYAVHTIAYFSAEFGFHESLPIYSGGLGVLAGDHCKAASDLGVPLVGVGLLYKEGYFKQKIDSEGKQSAEYPSYDFSRLPVCPAKYKDEDVFISLEMPGRTLHAQVWMVRVGTVRVYLLDTDLSRNRPEDRRLTSRLYGGDHELRLQQEMLLGIGGMRALQAAGIRPKMCHINEGHAAFLSFEKIRELMLSGNSFDTAFEAAKGSTTFTTHTPVPAGHDAFSPALLEHYFRPFFDRYQLNAGDFLKLGMDYKRNVFNMTYLALNTASFCNGVSKLHGQVSREMFREFYGCIEPESVPIRSVTNGVHGGTWTAPEIKRLYAESAGNSHDNANSGDVVGRAASYSNIPDDLLRETHAGLKRQMMEEVRRRLKVQYARNNETQAHIDAVDSDLSGEELTVGFARRFATYKRANLLFSDLPRLERLLNDPERPLRFIFAGKAHPADLPGQSFIQQIYQYSRMDAFRGKIVLVENYDMELARFLVRGVDVWLNNPERPLEASGTSGQKAAMNGVVNLSVLDGWWEEGYDGSNGWAIGGDGLGDAESLYKLLEEQVIPLYYGASSPSPQWVGLMKRSMETLAPVYNTERMVKEYVEKAYIPVIERSARLEHNRYALAEQLGKYKRFIRENWRNVAILGVDDDPASSYAFVGKGSGGSPAGAGTGGGGGLSGSTVAAGSGSGGGLSGSLIAKVSAVEGLNRASLSSPAADGTPPKKVTARIRFGPVWYKDTSVEVIYYEEVKAGVWKPVIAVMELSHIHDGVCVYVAEVPSHLKHGPHFSVRVRPVSPNFSDSFELPLITTT